MLFGSLGSGSKGNSLLIRSSKTCLMVDNGFSVRETEKRLARLKVNAESITGILVTHEHSDHINGVGALARKYQVTVYATRGTFASGRMGEVADKITINSHKSFAIGDLYIDPFPVPHDASEPCQFVIGDGERRLGILTDTGSCTPHIEDKLSGCDALIIECNHDVTMLEQGDYPYNVKLRVAGDYGHLNNEQAAGLVQNIDTSSLQHIIAAHISEKHNTKKLAQRTLSNALHCQSDWISLADQQTGFDWRQVS